MSDSVSFTTQILHGNTNLTNSLYQILSKKDGNVFFSPFSIHAILSMAYQGALEKTAEVLSKTLAIPDQKSTALAYKSIIEHLKSAAQDAVLLTAFKIYAKRSDEDSVLFIEEFEKSVKENFLADVEFVDFMKKKEAVKMINGWIEQTIREKIKAMIDEDFLEEDTSLLLLNAIYFKGDWADQFGESSTQNQEFYVDDDTTIEVKMMKRKGVYKYKNDDELNAKIIEIPYKGNEVSMVIILPREKNGIKDLEAKLASIDLGQITQDLNRWHISLSVPKFKIEETMDLDDTMIQMGLKDIFDKDKANFRAMVDLRVNENLYVGKIIQKAFIEVNEKGAEAAAVTVVKMRKMVKRLKVINYQDFEVDHPAIFMLVTYQNSVVNILFLGRLTRPKY